VGFTLLNRAAKLSDLFLDKPDLLDAGDGEIGGKLP
jgi:hypothetical protein